MTGSPPEAPATTPHLAAAQDRVPRVVAGRYRIERLLGEGAHGAVYEAIHLGLGRAFALKLLKVRPEAGSPVLARFQREAEALGRLHHPNVVDVTDFGVDPDGGGGAYLVTERLAGSTLAQHGREKGRLPMDVALPILDAVASAVDHAHAHGILHRDLKPGNVVLHETPEGLVPKVLDFGLAAWGEAGAVAPRPDPRESVPPAEGDLTATGDLVGTPRYAAPEVIRSGDSSGASDVYSFGVLAYEVLVGRPPFIGTVADVIEGHLRREVLRPSALGVPMEPGVEDALLAPLAKDPASRPPTAGAVVQALRRARAAGGLTRWRRAELPQRTALAAALTALALPAALLVARLPPLRAGELWLQDLRFAAAARRPPDPRILLVSIDEESLRNDPAPLTERADEFARELDHILDAGASGVALDMVLPARWSASEAFSDFVVRRSDRLTLAAMARADGPVVGLECLSPLTVAALGPERSGALFGIVNLDVDVDGAVRRGRLRYGDDRGRPRATWAARAVASLESPAPGDFPPPFVIDHRVDRAGFPTISWRKLPDFLAQEPGQLRGRLVLVGGDVRPAGDDAHRVPSGRTASPVSGLVVQALLVDTLLAGVPVREAGAVATPALAAVLSVIGSARLLCARRLRAPVSFLLGSAGVYVAGAFAVFLQAGVLLPVTPPLLTMAVGVLLAFAARARLRRAPEGKEAWR